MGAGRIGDASSNNVVNFLSCRHICFLVIFTNRPLRHDVSSQNTANFAQFEHSRVWGIGRARRFLWRGSSDPFESITVCVPGARPDEPGCTVKNQLTRVSVELQAFPDWPQWDKQVSENRVQMDFFLQSGNIEV